MALRTTATPGASQRSYDAENGEKPSRRPLGPAPRVHPRRSSAATPSCAPRAPDRDACLHPPAATAPLQPRSLRPHPRRARPRPRQEGRPVAAPQHEARPRRAPAPRASTRSRPHPTTPHRDETDPRVSDDVLAEERRARRRAGALPPTEEAKSSSRDARARRKGPPRARCQVARAPRVDAGAPLSRPRARPGLARSRAGARA